MGVKSTGTIRVLPELQKGCCLMLQWNRPRTAKAILANHRHVEERR
jgi:hypothetical protein